ncbi:putative disease resistance protein At4g10780 [Macadamia integrifolia]|uniref:putative disease resistance protein At4g10780 n=1 Tax=Macadamia integrifolia TaxID=60698 RepID=UPI001C4EBB5D|nr:putative disease resistance protein At4g10780 [Macadamia integrifolia]
MANRHGDGEGANAIREMEQSATELRGMKDKVLVPLKFSFDRLEDDMLRNIFLYCNCFTEDYSIMENEILNYYIGEGLVDRLNSLTAAMNKGESLIGSLKIACMLEDGESEGSVRMHDMMRELALWITSSELNSSSKFLIRNGESFKEAPQANEWLDATQISLMDTQIEELPELGERCQKLTTLLLRRNRILTVPPTNFLQHMDHLSVLDLSHTYTLEYLPRSLSCLVNLRVLSLRWCSRLRALPALEMLRQLQVLDLCRCLALDQQILGSICVGGMSNLRYLDVTKTNVSIPAGVISSLLKLENLRLYRADNIIWRMSENEKWDWSGSDGKGQWNEGNNENKESSGSCDDHQPSIIDVRELHCLTHLTSLDISFRGIIISDWFRPLAKKMMALVLEHCRVIKQDAIQVLNESQKLQMLEIHECPGPTCVPIRVG